MCAIAVPVVMQLTKLGIPQVRKKAKELFGSKAQKSESHWMMEQKDSTPSRVARRQDTEKRNCYLTEEQIAEYHSSKSTR